jgi:hypothetical protein
MSCSLLISSYGTCARWNRSGEMSGRRCGTAAKPEQRRCSSSAKKVRVRWVGELPLGAAVVLDLRTRKSRQ